MKKIVIGILSFVFIAAFISCSTDTNPQIRVKNERSDTVNILIQSSENNKIKINDVEPGETSGYQSIPEGNITATAVIQNESVSFMATKNTAYTIIISIGKSPEITIDK